MAIQNKKILVIDDNAEIHEDFRQALAPGVDRSAMAGDPADIESSLGERAAIPTRLDLVTALQGEEGIQIVEEAASNGEPFAVAFVDYRMPPGLDGVRTLRRLWAADPEIQTVLCTTFNEFSVHQILEELGECDRLLILKKPFDLAEIYLLATTLTRKWQSNHEMQETLKDLERAHDSLNEFTHFISRDLKEPLHGIQNHAEYLFQVGRNSLSKPHLSMIDNVNQLSHRMESLLDSLIEYSRLSRYNYEVEEVELDELLAESIDILEISGHPVSTCLDVPEPLPRVRCHRALVREALMHLIRNALQYNHSPRKLVQVRWTAECLGDGGSPRLEISVHDNGVGIESEDQARIFEVFQKVPSREDGSAPERAGIGLSMVKKIIELHGGDIRVESGRGEGSTFTFTLGPHALVRSAEERLETVTPPSTETS